MSGGARPTDYFSIVEGEMESAIPHHDNEICHARNPLHREIPTPIYIFPDSKIGISRYATSDDPSIIKTL